MHHGISWYLFRWWDKKEILTKTSLVPLSVSPWVRGRGWQRPAWPQPPPRPPPPGWAGRAPSPPDQTGTQSPQPAHNKGVLHPQNYIGRSSSFKSTKSAKFRHSFILKSTKLGTAQFPFEKYTFKAQFQFEKYQVKAQFPFEMYKLKAQFQF